MGGGADNLAGAFSGSGTFRGGINAARTPSSTLMMMGFGNEFTEPIGNLSGAFSGSAAGATASLKCIYTDTSNGTLWMWFDGGDDSTKYTDSGTTLVSADGDRIQQWNRKHTSAVIDYCRQTTLANKPTHKVNINNGRSAVLFSPNQLLTLHSTGAALTNILTLYLVCKVNNTVGIKYVLGGVTEAMSFRFDGSEKLAIMWEDTAQLLLATTATSSADHTITCAQISSNAQAIYKYDNSANGTATEDASGVGGNPTNLGAYSTGAYGFDGYFDEVIGYVGYHNSTVRAKILANLSAKHNLSS